MRSRPALTVATVLLACSCVAGKAGTPILSSSGVPSPSVSAPPTSTAVPSPSRPNVLVIVADDQRWDTLSVMPKTRRWIGDAGATFPHAMVATPLCCPSRSSIFIGDYAHNTGVHDNGDTAWQVIPQSHTIQDELQGEGYQTGIVGKYFNTWPLANRPPFFDRWAVFTPGEEGGGGYFGTVWNVDGTIVHPAAYSTDFAGNQGIRFLNAFEQQDSKPWFLYLAPFAPHGPATPAPAYASAPVPPFHPDPAVLELDRSDKPPWNTIPTDSLAESLTLRTDQFRALRSVDDMVGRVMRWLADNHEARNTLVIYIGDNGVLWGEHGLGHKGYPYLPDLRVPLMMRWPGHVAPGSIDHRLAGNIDLAPTILDATGATAHHPIDGRSLLRSWTRPVFLAESWRNPNPSFPAPTWGSLVTRRYQYIEYDRNGTLIYREYYDLVHDPWELSNLFADGIPGNEPNAKLLHARLAALRHCIGPACR